MTRTRKLDLTSLGDGILFAACFIAAMAALAILFGLVLTLAGWGSR